MKEKAALKFLITTGYNDLDHITPVVFFLKKLIQTEHDVDILMLYNAFFFDKNDPRLLVLKSLKGVRIQFVGPSTLLWRFFKNVIVYFQGTFPHLFNRHAGPIKTFFSRAVLQSPENLRLSSYIDPDRKTFVFLGHAERFVVEELNKIKVKNNNIKITLLPHGFTLCSNKLLTIRDLNWPTSIYGSEVFSSFDRIVVTAEVDFQGHITHGCSADRVVRLPSARFSGLWLRTKKDLCIDGLSPDQDADQLRLLFLQPTLQANIFAEEFIRSVKLALNFSGTVVAVKMRSSAIPEVYRSFTKRKDFLAIGAEYSTSAMIDWADVVLHCGTTLQAELFRKDKVSVLLGHCTCNRLYASEMGCGVTTRTRDDLMDLLDQIKENKKKYSQQYKLLNEESCDQFLRQFVGDDTDVVDEYHQFFESI